MSLNLGGWPKPTKPKAPGSCAECRRRKLKCQRTFPCQNCENIGRAEACLQSAVVKGTRSLKPSQVIMQEDLTVMSVRKEMLEAALAELQATISAEPHPLLMNDSQIRTASPVPGVMRTNDAAGHDDEHDSPDATDDLVEALGMMSIRGTKSQYHGLTVSSEFVVKETNGADGREPAHDPPARRRPSLLRLPLDLVLLSALFPFPPMHERPVDMDIFLDYLPPYERAFALIENYFTRFSWCSLFFTPSQIYETIFSVFYPDGVKTTNIQLKDAHCLSVLFMIFLLGTLYDLDIDIQQFTAETEEYHNLARAALVVDPVADNPTVHGVQGLALMTWYFRLFPGRRSHSYQWNLSGILTKLIIATGLHRDHCRVLPDPRSRTLYELTFWEYHSVDIWQSFMYGRPTSLSNEEIDCKIALHMEVAPGQDPAFFPWKYSFTLLVSRVVAHLSNDLPYTDLLKYDQMLRDHYTPDSLIWPPEDAPLGQGEAVGKTFQRYLMSVWKNVSIMYIHRQLAVQTILEHKEEAIKSPVWHSVMSTYKSAAALTRNTRRMWQHYRREIERMGPFWSHAQSAALVLCALVTRIPRWEHAEDAMRLVDETCEMFMLAKDESLQPSNALSSLQKHQNQAHYAFRKARGPERSASMPRGPEGSLSPADSEFRFDFGDSPGVHRMANGLGDTPSPPENGGYGKTTKQEARQWGQYLKDMGVQY